jgi:hypothetical protein
VRILLGVLFYGDGLQLLLLWKPWRLPSLAWRKRRAGFFSRHRQPGMGRDPIDGIFLGGEFSKVAHGTIRPHDFNTPNPALKHSQ